MIINLLKRLTYANVMATLAFFLALSGASYAAVNLPDKSVGTQQLKPHSVGGKQLKKKAVARKHLKAKSVTTKKLVDGSVGGDKLADGGVSGDKLADGSVGSGKLTANSVGNRHLRTDSVQERNLAPNSVGPKSLQGNAVGSDQLAPDSVGQREVKPGSLLFEDFDANQVSPRLFAHSSSAGTLGVNSGVVSLTRTSKGIYEYQFNRDLHGCVPVANVGFGHNPGVIGAGATAQASLFGDSGVRVTVYRLGYTFNSVEDDDTNLIVLC